MGVCALIKILILLIYCNYFKTKYINEVISYRFGINRVIFIPSRHKTNRRKSK